MNNSKKFVFLFSFMMIALLFNYSVYGVAEKGKSKGVGLAITSTNPKANSVEVDTKGKIVVTYNSTIKKNSGIGNVRLIDEENNYVTIDVRIEGMKIVINPVEELDYNRMYTVNIPSDAVKDKSNAVLKSSYKFSFTTKKSEIDYIENLVIEVNSEEDYKLPDKVEATFVDGTTGEVNIVWDEVPIIDEAAGETTFIGSVKGYDEPVTLTFKLTSTSEIAFIDNIDETISVGDEYSLPETVTAINSDDSIGEVEVSWGPDRVDTSVPGEYTFTGTVKGYNGIVILTLTIVD